MTFELVVAFDLERTEEEDGRGGLNAFGGILTKIFRGKGRQLRVFGCCESSEAGSSVFRLCEWYLNKLPLSRIAGSFGNKAGRVLARPWLKLVRSEPSVVASDCKPVCVEFLRSWPYVCCKRTKRMCCNFGRRVWET